MPRSFIFVLALLVGSLGLNLKLAWQLKALQPPIRLDKTLGKHVGNFQAADLAGGVRNISFDVGKSTLVYYIDPECKWCKANAKSFNKLANKAELDDVRVIVLSPRAEKMEEFLSESHLPPDKVYVLRTDSLSRELGLTGTPQTFLVGANGKVERHWIGAYDGHNRNEIEKTFNLNLPDITEP